MLHIMIKKSFAREINKAMGKDNLEALKKEIISILEKADSKEYKKAIEFFEETENHYTHLEKSISGEWIEKAGYGVGTVRIWRGKKYKKVAPKKWVRVFDKMDRGAKGSMTRLINKVKACNSEEELYQFCMSNHSIFQDENGNDLPIMDKLRAAIDDKKETITGESKKYTYGLGEEQNMAKQQYNEEVYGDKKVKKEEADLHNISRKLSQIPTTELRKERDKLQRAVENKTRSKRDGLNNAIFSESNKKQLDNINKELEKRDEKKNKKESKNESTEKRVYEEEKAHILNHTNKNYNSIENAIADLNRHKDFIDRKPSDETEHERIVREAKLKATDDIITGLRNSNKELLGKFIKETDSEKEFDKRNKEYEKVDENTKLSNGKTVKEVREQYGIKPKEESENVFTKEEIDNRIANGKKMIDEYFEENWNKDGIYKENARIFDIWAAGDAKNYVSPNLKSTAYKGLRGKKKEELLNTKKKIDEELENYASTVMEKYQNKESNSEKFWEGKVESEVGEGDFVAEMKGIGGGLYRNRFKTKAEAEKSTKNHQALGFESHVVEDRKESEQEKHQNRSDAMKGNQNAYKDGLDKDLIRNANGSSNMYEPGDAIEREFKGGLKAIDMWNLSDEEKEKAKQKLFELSTEELKAQSGAISVTASGPARRVKGADKKFEKVQKIRGEKQTLLNELREKSRKADNQEETKNIVSSAADAIKENKLSFISEGKLYYRGNTKSNSWTVIDKIPELNDDDSIETKKNQLKELNAKSKKLGFADPEKAKVLENITRLKNEIAYMNTDNYKLSKDGVEKSLFDDFVIDMFVDDELEDEEDKKNFIDNDASQPELFNSVSYKVSEALNSVFGC